MDLARSSFTLYIWFEFRSWENISHGLLQEDKQGRGKLFEKIFAVVKIYRNTEDSNTLQVAVDCVSCWENRWELLLSARRTHFPVIRARASFDIILPVVNCCFLSKKQQQITVYIVFQPLKWDKCYGSLRPCLQPIWGPVIKSSTTVFNPTTGTNIDLRLNESVLHLFAEKPARRGGKTTHDNRSESNSPSTNREEVGLVAWLVEVHGQHSDWLYFLETWLVFHLSIFLLRPRPSLTNALHLPFDLFEINQKGFNRKLMMRCCSERCDFLPMGFWDLNFLACLH